MTAAVEIWTRAGCELVALETDVVTIGQNPENTIALHDPKVSRVHATLAQLGPAWCVRDLSSTNGTFVNGTRIWAERPLRPGDEVVVGSTRLVFRDGQPGVQTLTEAAEPAPVLTPREHDVLLALCEPVLRGDIFTEPASTAQIANALVVTEAAVKQHLGHLYEKFSIGESESRKRVRLANEAVHRGAVTLADLRAE